MSDIMPSPDELMRQHEHAALRDERAIAERDAALADCSTAEGNLGAAMARANGLELALGRAQGHIADLAKAGFDSTRRGIASKALAAIEKALTEGQET